MTNHSPLRDYTFLGTTQSLCPECRSVVPAKIIARGARVYFRKKCKEHGVREDFICSDVTYYDRHELDQPARMPRHFGTEPERGCPLDCGLCTEHEQHTCIALIELTTSCNLTCPMCFAESGPGGKHIEFGEYCQMVDRLVFLEGTVDVLQLSGGEPTLHPDLIPMLQYAASKPISAIMINTNGVRLAKDHELVQQIATLKDRVEIYLQFDGFDETVSRRLRGEALVETKLQALDAIAQHDLRCTLVCTVEHNTNLHELGQVVNFGLSRPEVRGVSFQLASYCGRHVEPENLEQRVTMPDAVRAIVEQTGDLLAENDFLPLPCAHPNCHMMCYLYRGPTKTLPINRLIDVKPHLDLVANSIVFTPARLRQLLARSLESIVGCGCGPDGCGPPDSVRDEFIERALGERITGRDTFRLVITAFLDVYNFDVRRVMKCCLGHVLPTGHMVPFCAYNTLYRDGFVTPPALADAAGARAR